MSSKSAEVEGNNPYSNTSMTSPDLVCKDTKTLHSESNSAPDSSPSSVIRPGGTSSLRDEQFSAVSRLGCLRRSTQTLQLSEEAEDLICNPWGKGHHHLTIQLGKSGLAAGLSKTQNDCKSREVL